MKSYEKIIAEAIRIEYSENEGKLYLVFEITDPQTKKDIMNNWTKDLEYRLINRLLVENNEK